MIMVEDSLTTVVVRCRSATYERLEEVVARRRNAGREQVPRGRHLTRLPLISGPVTTTSGT
jgi:hypothetical protein